ncbi:MAG TPA: DUF6502 family protein [Hydrogenophaga sp.]|uniref:DUF6502 family protein n=1 Tax=Hydrogenophaga sp. TaxID=1904254 RepID=UPI002BCD1ED0|nr:DUF6502 family protein [Hydrogenophaga sp.]HMN92791.1 DUF6502 family protein [Hydrogenophaga sp.]HMP10368.1 DUF6502 family protein [Hydrogenophaga sp.]
MDQGSFLERAIDLAVARLLRPLFRVLLRHGKSYRAFEEVAKRTYVDVALSDFGIPGKKPSVSRVSILSGLTRKEVQRLLQAPALEDTGTGERRNRAARVLTGWLRDPDFLDPQGDPLALDVEGERGFAALVRRHSGDMPTRAVLDELLRVGAVDRLPDGRIVLLARGYVPRQGAREMVDILGADVADLIETIDHNLHQGHQAPRFQRKVMYRGVPVQALPAFRALSAQQAQALLEQLDRWLQSTDSTPPATADAPAGARVGMGIYYFEEVPLDPTRSPGDPS